MYESFDKNIKYLKGVGTQRAELFERLGIKTALDLVRFYPRNYEDWSVHVDICDVIPDEVNVIKACVDMHPQTSYLPGGRTVYKTLVSDESGRIELVFFNNKFIPKILHEGQTYYFRGKVNFSKYSKSMTSPEFYTENKARTILPIYPATSGLSSLQISNVVGEALKILDNEDSDSLSDEIRQKFSLCKLKYALKNIHFPLDISAIATARKRLIFEELLILQLGMRKIKDINRAENSHIVKNLYTREFAKLLPFELTHAQKVSIMDCLSDMQKKHPMNRLLQGDVGSGKTAVAAAICHTSAKNSIQCAMMAPTEILATQHFHSLNELLSPANIRVALLTGSLTPKRKKIVYDALAKGEIDLVVGTHALLSKGVQFQNLGLVITDEQHRFGVKQRGVLAEKGIHPHTLVMSATPIPRTLALMIYGDLDISILNQLPKGRQKIETYAVGSALRQRAYNYVKKHIAEGRQGYIVCPLIEESESDLASIETYYEQLIEHFPADIIGVLHGKMKPKDKDAVMEKFSKNEIKLLLSTTVVEVGVDVPNAVIMIIENAERYGLSQLHQLRGRVGRGKHKSTCILISDAKTDIASERMKLMCESSDGFKIAEVDLQMRGPGDFFGKRQHGLPQLKIADMVNDMDTLKDAQVCANEILETDPNLDSHAEIKLQIQKLYQITGEQNGVTV